MIYHPIGHAVSQEPIDLTHEHKRRTRDRVYRGAHNVRTVPNMAIFDIGDATEIEGVLDLAYNYKGKGRFRTAYARFHPQAVHRPDHR